MLKISYKAAYHLIEPFYGRRSLNQVVYGDNVPDNVFESSKITAEGIEDYTYLEIMVNRKDDLDKKYALFGDINDNSNIPIVLEKDIDLTLLEFGVLAHKCTLIDRKLFMNVIEAQAEGKGENAELCVEAFKGIIELVPQISEMLAAASDEEE